MLWVARVSYVVSLSLGYGWALWRFMKLVWAILEMKGGQDWFIGAGDSVKIYLLVPDRYQNNKMSIHPDFTPLESMTVLPEYKYKISDGFARAYLCGSARVISFKS